MAVVVALWIAASWWVVAVHPWAGPVLFTVTETNGLHLGNVPAVALAAAATAYCSRRRRMTAKRREVADVGSADHVRGRPRTAQWYPAAEWKAMARHGEPINRRTPPGEPNSAALVADWFSADDRAYDEKSTVA
jgi:hypothetical protein